MIDKVFAEGISNNALPWSIGKSGESIAGGIFSAVLGLLLIGAGLMTFTQLVLGGIQWITSGGDKAGLEAARNKIIHGIIGLILVASSWAIIILVLGKFLGMDFPTIKIPTIGESVSGGGSNPGGGTAVYLQKCQCINSGVNGCATEGTLSFQDSAGQQCKKCTIPGWIDQPVSNCEVGKLKNGSCGTPCK